jgi:bifunctional non-homologous end joining protein LigD
VIFEHACALGLEGIVSKLLDSRYTSGRTRDWVKGEGPGRAEHPPFGGGGQE